MPVLSNAPLAGGISSTSFIGGIAQAAGNSIGGQLGVNPFMNRQNVNGMFAYSTKNTGGFQTNGPNILVNYPQASFDWRVRVSLAPNSKYFYNDPSNNLLSPLRTEASNNVTSALVQGIDTLTGGATNGQTRIGVVFPYTPTVAVTHTANYEQQKLTHNNYAQYFYQNSEVGEITINGEFTVQNVTEGQYLLATIYFFRSVTKMFFGNDADAGNPPPIVYLNGYGQYYLPNVPCIVKSFSHTMPAEVDYMDIPEPGINYNPYLSTPVQNSTRLPTTSTVSLTLQPVYSRTAQSFNFNLNDFARGALINTRLYRAGGPATAFGATVPALNGGNAGTGGFL